MTRTLRRFLALCVIVFCVGASPAAALYHDACWVKVLHQFDRISRQSHQLAHYSVWSGVAAAQCNYLTGSELNDRTRQQRYPGDEVYILIIWPDRKRSIVQLGGLTLCGPAAEAGCADSLSGVLSGQEDWHDQYGRRSVRWWQICRSGVFERDCYKELH